MFKINGDEADVVIYCENKGERIAAVLMETIDDGLNNQFRCLLSNSHLNKKKSWWGLGDTEYSYSIDITLSDPMNGAIHKTTSEFKWMKGPIYPEIFNDAVLYGKLKLPKLKVI